MKRCKPAPATRACWYACLGSWLLGACLPALGRSAPPPTAATLQHLTQALVDALAPGERTLWERYTDPALVYVTEDNEVKTRAPAG